MTDRPILFSAPMVRAILREIGAPGTGKTQTRRLLKRPSDHFHASYTQAEISGLSGHVRWWDGSTGHAGRSVRLPYSPDDRLWVREAWAAGACANGLAPSCLHPAFWLRDNGGLWYAADEAEPAHPVTPKGPNRPGIHMPRWASRLTLHVTDVRVQRLQDISEDDARAEGIEHGQDRSRGNVIAWRDYLDRGGKCGTAIASFRSLWDSLNAERAPWASNPWVVAVTFRPVLGNIDRVAA
ncbi:hypothetical protein LOS78_01975 [Paracoccus sp. MA]|uniref:hypothetical protein n=1 Tax=Paracoccus sp. MA TaxID=2895796 RepID=UPI001E5643A5|nr:hypothetical protein [Paracoccus sp. MA]UFM64268.1 hypothetical protein LOS78_01975 [Paracoccus sp. MA]